MTALPYSAIGRSAACLLLALATAWLGGCATSKPMDTVDYVDLERYMGDWYVIAHIPTPLEDEAYNAVESYELNDDGTIATTFTFREGAFDGEEKVYHPKGFVRNEETNALWGMQFIWPIKADFRIVYLDEDYQTTVIGRKKRDYVWLMAREPQMDPATYAEVKRFIGDLGYSFEDWREVPHQW